MAEQEGKKAKEETDTTREKKKRNDAELVMVGRNHIHTAPMFFVVWAQTCCEYR